MHKITSIFAALALTAYPINIDSQYGLRLEPRRVVRPDTETPKSPEFASPEEYVSSIEHPDFVPAKPTAQPKLTSTSSIPN